MSTHGRCRDFISIQLHCHYVHFATPAAPSNDKEQAVVETLRNAIVPKAPQCVFAPSTILFIMDSAGAEWNVLKKKECIYFYNENPRAVSHVLKITASDAAMSSDGENTTRTSGGDAFARDLMMNTMLLLRSMADCHTELTRTWPRYAKLIFSKTSVPILSL